MLKTEKINGYEVSINREDLLIEIDIWGKGKDTFSAEFGGMCHTLWQTYQANPLGKPARSRSQTSFGVGEIALIPTVIKAEFVCKEDTDDFERIIREELEKDESYTDLVKLKEDERKRNVEDK